MAKDNTVSSGANTPQKDEFNWKDFMETCLRKWAWFLGSLIFFVGVGIVYILHTQPSYEREEEVLIKDTGEGGDIGDIAGGFSSLGLLSSNTNVNNELIALTSPAVMYQVVDRLDLTMNYAIKENFLRWNTLWGTTQPGTIIFEDIDPDESVGFKGYIQPDLSIKIFQFYTIDKFGKKEKIKKEVTIRPGEALLGTPLGKIIYRANHNYSEEVEEPAKFNVFHQSRQGTTEQYVAKLNGELSDPDADVINLSIKDVSIQRANAILSTIVDVYNENWMSDKNRISKATSRFIEDRLVTLQHELGDVDDEISRFRSEHKMSDYTEMAKLTLGKQMESHEAIIGLENNLELSSYLMDFLKNPQNAKTTIPLINGIGNPTIASLISKYDEMMTSRNNIAAHSSDNNPLVLDLERQLVDVRASIITNLEKQQMVTRNQLAIQKRELGQSEAELTEAPIRSKQLLGANRQQAVKQSLYLYLLQKREETELSQKFTADNTRVITPPYGKGAPVSPKKFMIIAVMIILGLGIPGGILYLKAYMDDAIRSRKDLEKVQMPFAGEIPFFGKKKRFMWLKKILGRDKAEKEQTLKVVGEGKRDIVNEAFRVIRSNIDLMSRKDKGCQTIMLTSFNAGSGKSFIAYNLGLTFGLKRKKVLLIDCDLRHGSLSMYVDSPDKGLSNYLSGSTDNWQSLLVKAGDNGFVDVMPIGYRPPNPAELLEDGRLGTLIKDAEKEYDYILLDCPPTDIVVDTQIVQQYVGSTLLVVRAGLFKKNQTPDIAELKAENKYPHMSLILNGTESGMTRYHAYGSSDYYSSKQ